MAVEIFYLEVIRMIYTFIIRFLLAVWKLVGIVTLTVSRIITQSILLSFTRRRT